MIDAAVISDLHLGSPVCEAKTLAQFLQTIKHDIKRLILNGDVFDSIDMTRLKKHHWKVLSIIRKLSDHVEVVWIRGNHDGPADLVSHLLGVTVVDEYVLESGDKKILFLHGDRFDTFLTEHPILTWIGDTIYNFLQWIDRSHYVARMAKTSSKEFQHNSEVIRTGALSLAKELGCDIVCTGHTHGALAEEDGYYNSGCWTEKPCSYLLVEDGKVALHFMSPEVELDHGTETQTAGGDEPN